MRIASWNVNGLRAISRKPDFAAFLTSHSPSVLCLQETKGSEEELVTTTPLPEGYKHYWNSANRKGYSGTAIFTKIQPLKVWSGLSQPLKAVSDDEGRVISAEFSEFVLVNTYSPNTAHIPQRLDFRVLWDDAIRDHIRFLRQELRKPVVILGDLNVAHTVLDLARPAENHEKSGFTTQEREGFTKLLKEGFVDSFRFKHGDVTECYSYWDYRMRSRSRNMGWRIDYALVDKALAPLIKDALIFGDIAGSDHCPIAVDFDPILFSKDLER